MCCFKGSKAMKNQEKIRRRRYWRTNHKSRSPYHSLSERRAYAAARDAKEETRAG